MRRKIPTGRVFKKTYTDRNGKTCKTHTYYLKYYVKGNAVELSTGTDNYDDALDMLRGKMRAAARQTEYTEHAERVRIGQLLDMLIEDYRSDEHRSTYDTELRVNKHLRPFFGETKAADLHTNHRDQYVAHRRRQKAEAATINKELAWLRRALNLGFQNIPPLVEKVPHFKMLRVDNVREGLLAHDQYRAIRDSLPPYGRIALVIAYHTGSRKGEIRSIRKDKIDLKAGRIYLPGRTTKNKTPRYLPIYGDMAAELDMALSRSDPRCPFLIQDEGKQVFDFEKAWATACKLAGIPDALFHDLRRTAVSNMIAAGLSEKEAMEISGHKTRAIFDRYTIVNDGRMAQNAKKLEQHLKAKEAEMGQDSGASQERRIN
jgi:integrase